MKNMLPPTSGNRNSSSLKVDASCSSETLVHLYQQLKLYITYKCHMSKISTFTTIATSDRMWHLLAFYLHYIAKNHLEGISSILLKFLDSFVVLFTHDERAADNLRPWPGYVGIYVKFVLEKSYTCWCWECILTCSQIFIHYMALPVVGFSS
jgi:hypothetical protein